METEITCRIPRETLVGLLDTMDPIENQRITAEIPVAVPLEPDDSERITAEIQAVAMPAELVIRFNEATSLNHARMVVILASFVVALWVGLLTLVL